MVHKSIAKKGWLRYCHEMYEFSLQYNFNYSYQTALYSSFRLLKLLKLCLNHHEGIGANLVSYALLSAHGLLQSLPFKLYGIFD